MLEIFLLTATFLAPAYAETETKTFLPRSPECAALLNAGKLMPKSCVDPSQGRHRGPTPLPPK